MPDACRAAEWLTRTALTWCLAAVVVVTSGCGPSEIRPEGDAAAARAAVADALEGWKTGETPEEMMSGSPALRVSDEDWRAGKKLVGFEIVDEPVQNGSHWRVYALLTLANARPSRVCYAVTPGSPASVIRSDFLD